MYICLLGRMESPPPISSSNFDSRFNLLLQVLKGGFSVVVISCKRLEVVLGWVKCLPIREDCILINAPIIAFLVRTQALLILARSVEIRIRH